MGNACLQAGIQESEFGAVWQRGFHKITIAPLDDPLFVPAKEPAKKGEALLQRFALRASIPSDFVQGQTWNVCTANEPASHRAFASARVA